MPQRGLGRSSAAWAGKLHPEASVEDLNFLRAVELSRLSDSVSRSSCHLLQAPLCRCHGLGGHSHMPWREAVHLYCNHVHLDSRRQQMRPAVLLSAPNPRYCSGRQLPHTRSGPPRSTAVRPCCPAAPIQVSGLVRLSGQTPLTCPTLPHRLITGSDSAALSGLPALTRIELEGSRTCCPV